MSSIGSTNRCGSPLGLPLVAFDLGAPAERIAHYPLGRVVTEVSADAALCALVDLRRALSDDAANPDPAKAEKGSAGGLHDVRM